MASNKFSQDGYIGVKHLANLYNFKLQLKLIIFITNNLCMLLELKMNSRKGLLRQSNINSSTGVMISGSD